MKKKGKKNKSAGKLIGPGDYEKELTRLQAELVKLQYWVKATGQRIVVVFEGRDAAGKGGVIKRLTEKVSPRTFRVVALPAPTDRQRTQVYFQRYLEQFPSAGEVVVFDRSWYNRAGVEYVMGYCTKEQHAQFLRVCPRLELDLIESDIRLVKYWFEVSADEQTRRFQSRIEDPTKIWKLSPMDIEAHQRWSEYSEARDKMFAATDTKGSPWHVVPADNKKLARLNCIAHFLSLFDYEDLTPKGIKLPKRGKKSLDDGRMASRRIVPQLYRPGA